jgi:hypothetical protein
MNAKEQKKFDKLKKLVKSYGGKYVRAGYGVNAGGTRVHSFINASWHYSEKLTWKEQEEKIHKLVAILEKDGWEGTINENCMGRSIHCKKVIL